MVSNVVIDDTDTQHIAYAGPSDWTVLTGSTRQWESTVHSTRTYGAEASIRFLGSGFIMYGTIPAGSGTVFVDITIDGGSPTRVTRTSGSDNVYNDVFYQSPLLETDSAHTVVFINRGHSTDTSFQFDRVQLLALDADPTVLSPPSLDAGTPTTQAVASTTNSQLQPTTSSPDPSPFSSISGGSQISSLGSISSVGSTSGATSLGQTVTLTQQITNAGQSTLVTSTSTVVIDATGKQANNHHPLSAGTIAGIAIGALVILALFIAGCFVLKRRRGRSRGHQVLEDNELQTRQAHRSLSAPTPYHTEPQLLLIPPSKDDRSPQVIDGPIPEPNNHLSTSDEASIRTGSVTRTEIQLQDPSTSTHPNAPHGGNGDASGPSLPPGLTAREEGYESQRTSTFDAPPAYQPQRGSADGPRTSVLRSLLGTQT